MISSSQSPQPIRVLLVTNVRLYREGLAAALGRYPRLRISVASSVVDAASGAAEHSPDVAVLDMAMPGAFELMRELRDRAPGTRAIAFAIDDEVSTVVDCAEAGAAGYVTPDASIDDLAEAITRAAAGELLCTPRMVAALFRRVGELGGSRSAVDATAGNLTLREKEILALLRPGLSNKAIASTLNISEATVKNHVHHVLHKLKVESRHQAVARASSPDAPRKSRTSSR